MVLSISWRYKKVKKCWRLLLALFAFSLCSWTIAQTLTNSGVSQGAFLKVNDLYILYLYPRPPFLKDQLLMVPLRSFAELIGMNVSYNAETGGASIYFLGQMLDLLPNSSTAHMGSQLVELGHQPYLLAPYGVLIVPLEPLLDAFDIDWYWNAAHSMLSVSDSRIWNEESSATYENYRQDFRSQFIFVETHPESELLAPVSFRWHWEDKGLWRGKLEPAFIEGRGSRFTVALEPATSLSAPLSERLGVSILVSSFGYFLQSFGNGLNPVPGGSPPSGCAWNLDTSRLTCSGRVASTGNPIRFVLIRIWEAQVSF